MLKIIILTHKIYILNKYILGYIFNREFSYSSLVNFSLMKM